MVTVISEFTERTKRIALHNGVTFKTKAEHAAYVQGIEHACASTEIVFENMRNNARIISHEDSIIRGS